MLECELLVIALLLLTAATLAGTAQNGGKISPIQLVRNPSGRAGIGLKSNSPISDRPTTAIDPLSHVCVLRATILLLMLWILLTLG